MSAFNRAWMFLKQYEQPVSPQEKQQGWPIPIHIQQGMDRRIQSQMEEERLKQRQMGLPTNRDLNPQNYTNPATK